MRVQSQNEKFNYALLGGSPDDLELPLLHLDMLKRQLFCLTFLRKVHSIVISTHLL